MTPLPDQRPAHPGPPSWTLLPERHAPREVVVLEASLTLDEVCARIDRLTAALDPRLAETVESFRRARGMLQAAADTMRLLAQRSGGGEGPPLSREDLPRTQAPGRLGLPPDHGWFG